MRNPQTGLYVVVFMVLTALFAWPFLPDQVPIHWNIAGEVDNYGSPLFALLLGPVIGGLLLLLRTLLPHIDPHRAAYHEFGGTYVTIINAVILFMALVHILLIAGGFGLAIAIDRMISAGVGLLFVIIGNELGRVQTNWFVGVRTPWTLADPEVWRRTHRAAGRLMFGSGLLIIGAALFLPGWVTFAVIMLAVIALLLVSFGYSYLLWRRRQQSSS